MPSHQQLAAHIDKLNRDIAHKTHSRNEWMARRQTALGHLQHCSNVRVAHNDLHGTFLFPPPPSSPRLLCTGCSQADSMNLKGTQRLRDEKTMWQNRLNVANNHLQDYDEFIRRDRNSLNDAQRQLNSLGRPHQRH